MIDLKHSGRRDRPMNEQGCRVCITNDNDEIVKSRVFTGTYDSCVNYIRTHKPPSGYEFGVIYNNSGRMASVVF